MPFDLPINDVKVYVQDAIEQLGVDCTLYGYDEDIFKVMISDIDNSTSYKNDYIKLAVMSKDKPVKKGSLLNIYDGQYMENGFGIVITTPTDDLVSYSMKLLLANGFIAVYDKTEQYDANGDMIQSDKVFKTSVHGYIERVGAKEKLLDLGLLHETTLVMTTYDWANVAKDDIVDFKGKAYRIVDIDDIEQGMLHLQLASVLT